MQFRRRLLLRCALLGGFAPAIARAQQAAESSVKAALVYKFASYVEWPAEAFASPEAPLVICVLGAEEVASDLEALVRGRAINNRSVVVRRLSSDAVAGCHIAFVGRRESPRLAALARASRAQFVLLVSDTERGLEHGSVINFVPVEDRLGFEVSIEAAERNHLRISSRMLAVARRVVPRAS